MFTNAVPSLISTTGIIFSVLANLLQKIMACTAALNVAGGIISVSSRFSVLDNLLQKIIAFTAALNVAGGIIVVSSNILLDLLKINFSLLYLSTSSFHLSNGNLYSNFEIKFLYSNIVSCILALFSSVLFWLLGRFLLLIRLLCSLMRDFPALLVLAGMVTFAKGMCHTKM